MNLNRTTTALSLLLSVLSVGAIAQPQITREQVKAELREAIRTGNIVEGEDGRTRYERNPSAYPPHIVVAGKTRSEVKAELAEAVRTGDIMVGESSLKLNEQHPGRYPKARSSTRPSEAPMHAESQLPQNSPMR
jgi:ribosomal protein L30E